MSAVVKGWCPSPRRPMASGDGLLMRLRPRAGRLTAAQLAALAQAATAHGSGWIALTARLSLQVRGVRPEGVAPLTAALQAAGLIDPDPAADARPALVMAPLSDALALHDALTAALAMTPPLPPKTGVALDAGSAPAMTRVSADVRVERDAGGALMVVADGEPCGRRVAEADAPATVLALLRAFAASGAPRVAQARLAWGDPARPRAAPAAPLTPGAHRFGAAFGLPFGRAPAAALARLAALAPAFRLAPGRLLLAMCATVPHDAAMADAFIVDPADPRLRVAACPGAPACASAEVATLALAADVAARLPAGAFAHVSGCAKGCAHPGAAALTLVGRAGRLDLVREGRASDAPCRAGLTPAQALEAMR